MKKKAVYVSSSLEDLRSYRAAVISALREAGYDPINMEDYGARAEEALEGCLADVARADFYVVILAWRYGYVVETKDKSFTELEYEYAHKCQKPCFVFHFDPNLPWEQPAFDDRLADDLENGKRIKRFRSETEKLIRARFRSADELAKQVLAALRRHESETLASSRQTPRIQAGLSRRTDASPHQLAVTGRVHPPAAWLALTLGWFQFLRKRKHCGAWRRAYLDQRALSNFPRDTNFQNELRLDWEGRNDTMQEQDRYFVIEGPAGVGKSSYLTATLEKMLSIADLVIQIETIKLEAALATNNGLGLWAVIRESHHEIAECAGVGSMLSEAALGYFLLRRRVLFVIEDLHQASAPIETLNAFKSYLRRSHEGPRHISVLITSRPLSQPLEAKRLVLKPLTQAEAQDYFYRLCSQNHMPIGQLTRHGERLARAFDEEPQQLPLFVVICAWLALQRGDIGEVLQMPEVELFDSFILELLKRAGTTQNGELWSTAKLTFREAYGNLALALWPEYRGMRDWQVAEKLKGSIDEDNPVHSFFLEQNGFLLRTTAGGLSFPHQKLSEYLAVEAMIRRRDFTFLMAKPEHATQLKSFLAILLKDDSAMFAELAGCDLPLFVQVAELRADRLSKGLFRLGDLGRACAKWCGPNAPRVVGPQIWVALQKVLAPVANETVAGFLTEVRSQSATAASIFMLAAFHRAECDAQLQVWLMNQASAKEFAAAVHLAQFTEGENTVIAALARCFFSNPRNSPPVRRLLRVLVEARSNVEAVQMLNKWIVRLSGSEMRRLLMSESDSTKLDRLAAADLACACEQQPERVKRQLSAQCAIQSGRALISPGVYKAARKGARNPTVRLNCPLLVDCVALKLPGLFTIGDLCKVRTLILRELGRSRVLREEEADVVWREFSFDPLNSAGAGVQFAAAKDNTGEYWETKEGGNFFFAMETGSSAIQLAASAHDARHTFEVAFRRCEDL